MECIHSNLILHMCSLMVYIVDLHPCTSQVLNTSLKLFEYISTQVSKSKGLILTKRQLQQAHVWTQHGTLSCAFVVPRCSCVEPRCACIAPRCVCVEPRCACIDLRCACVEPRCACVGLICACVEPNKCDRVSPFELQLSQSVVGAPYRFQGCCPISKYGFGKPFWP